MVKVGWKKGFKELFMEKWHCIILDAPGHRGSIKNRATGASQAHEALIRVLADGNFITPIGVGVSVKDCGTAGQQERFVQECFAEQGHRTIIESPGHRDLITNMFTGGSQAASETLGMTSTFMRNAVRILEEMEGRTLAGTRPSFVEIGEIRRVSGIETLTKRAIAASATRTSSAPRTLSGNTATTKLISRQTGTLVAIRGSEMEDGMDLRRPRRMLLGGFVALELMMAGAEVDRIEMEVMLIGRGMAYSVLMVIDGLEIGTCALQVCTVFACMVWTLFSFIVDGGGVRGVRRFGQRFAGPLAFAGLGAFHSVGLEDVDLGCGLCGLDSALAGLHSLAWAA